MQAPDWWFNLTGIFAFVGTVAFFAMTVVAFFVVRLLLDVRDSLRELNTRVNSLTDRVEAITETVQDVTTEVGSRTKGIVRIVDEHAMTALDLVEKVAPVLVGIGIIARVVGLLRGKR